MILTHQNKGPKITYPNEDDTFLNRCAGHAERLRQSQTSDRQFLFLLNSSPAPRQFESLIPLKDSSFHPPSLSEH